jgi:hypothetical protein
VAARTPEPIRASVGQRVRVWPRSGCLSGDGLSIATLSAKWVADKRFQFCATHWREATPDLTEGERVCDLVRQHKEVALIRLVPVVSQVRVQKPVDRPERLPVGLWCSVRPTAGLNGSAVRDTVPGRSSKRANRAFAWERNVSTGMSCAAATAAICSATGVGRKPCS